MLCKKCNQPIPVRMVIDGRERNLQRRKYCLTCSPFGQHNTRPIIDNPSLDGNRLCKKCGNPFVSTRRNVCGNCNVVKYRQQVKLKLVEYKGGKCIVCGYDRCMRNMIFHHLDPNEKEFGFSEQTKKFELMRKEVDKCILLCCRCHGEVHDGLIEIKNFLTN